ncbi:LytR family transcriptional regulator [Fervidicella metallireducens AeB]|uniref:LytR family transcriptional regulator n=1 Tax=Fervidicella metallireducens AeB TaxID=1403537 RepID=A0A017RYL8_9CLOT|nr:LCP family protein [Fervidicella metallireducens]EYE89772.1 LytR family transcriptional regulator [Fervidicella metallireducens AeB]
MARKKRKKTKKLFKILSLSVLFFAISLGGYAYYQLNKIKTNKISKSDLELGIKPQNQLDSIEKENLKDVINIALFGTDIGRSKGDVPHSDAIIIATIDPKHKKIKLSSIMRDTYVTIEGHGQTKITEAYTYGGPELAIKTLNQNFDLNIRDYATVNFFSLEKVIDILGGIEADIKDYEIKELNYRIKEVANLEGKNPTLIKRTGPQKLNGIQAVAYSRIRKVGNGDYERTERQRKVLSQLTEKVQNAGVSKYPTLVSQILPLVETSMSKIDIVKTGVSVLSSDIKAIDNIRFPLDEFSQGQIIDHKWFLVPKPDIKTTAEQIQKYIFEDIRPDVPDIRPADINKTKTDKKTSKAN